jgi:putative membrane protein
MSTEPSVVQPPPNSSFLLASQNTSLALQRTRMATDRTLMAVIRTSLSLISFGFTIYNLSKKLQTEEILKIDQTVPRFAIALVLLGIIMLIVGIAYHLQFMLQLRADRAALIADHLICGERRFPVSFTLLTAGLLLLLGVVAIISMIFHVGPLD